MNVKAYCMAGRHPGPDVGTTDDLGEHSIPPGWRYVKVQRTNDGKFVYNPCSELSILACPHHHYDGEPSNN